MAAAARKRRPQGRPPMRGAAKQVRFTHPKIKAKLLKVARKHGVAMNHVVIAVLGAIDIEQTYEEALENGDKEGRNSSKEG